MDVVTCAGEKAEGVVRIAALLQGLGEQRRVLPRGSRLIIASPHTEQRLPDVPQDSRSIVVGFRVYPDIGHQAKHSGFSVVEQRS